MPYRGWDKSVSLRHRLLWSVLLPMGMLLVVNIAVVSKFGYDSATRRHDRFLEDVGNLLVDRIYAVEDGIRFNGDSPELLPEDKKDLVFYSIRTLHGNYHFGAPDAPPSPDSAGYTPSYYAAIYRGKPVRVMTVIMQATYIPGEYVVVTVGKTLVLHRERAKEWIWGVLPANFLLMGLSAVLVWWGVRRGMRPLLHLRDEVTNRSSLDLHPLPEGALVSEVRPLIRSFNDLMARLDLSLTSQRRFISNAAHQLRTPLSGFKTQAELIMRMNSVEEIHRTMQQMHIAADQAGHMINQLLVLASSESDGQSAGTFSSLNLADLARDVTKSWVKNALKKDIDLGYECEGNDFEMTGNALLLGEMLNNLIDNALRYTQSGGYVTVRMGRDSGQMYLEVEDNGPGIPEGERERIFERFYRVQGGDQEGCGLGLSIVREIAHRHHAEIYVLPGVQGTLMRVVFGGLGSRE